MASLLNVYDNNNDNNKSNNKEPEVKKKVIKAPVLEEAIKEKPVVSSKPKESLNRKSLSKKDEVIFDEDQFTRSAKTLFRDDVDISSYSPVLRNIVIKPVDKNIEDFVSSFSRENKGNGGSSITVSQLVHTILDVAYYDIELAPQGFESVEELRTFLQERIK